MFNPYHSTTLFTSSYALAVAGNSPHRIPKICLQFESFIIVLFGVHILLHIRKMSDHFPCFQLFFLGYQVLEIYKIIYL